MMSPRRLPNHRIDETKALVGLATRCLGAGDVNLPHDINLLPQNPASVEPLEPGKIREIADLRQDMRNCIHNRELGKRPNQ